MRDAEWIRYSEFRIPNSEFRMKGVILAGGLGKRLEPLTRITNKHLLPVYDRPMIYFPVQTLVDAGLTEIMLVVGGNHAGEFLRLLGNGEEFGLRHLNYTYQRGEGGIAEALKLTEHFADGGKIVGIEEKPAQPKSSFVVTGIYLYDGQAFDIIKTLKPSGRGELEITDVNNAYIQRGQMAYDILEGWWTDAGLPETLYRATTLVRERQLTRPSA